MAQTHDPRPIARIVIPLYVEIRAAREEYAIKYIGSAVHEIVDSRADAHGNRSWERISPEDIADTILSGLRGETDPADSMWVVSRIAPMITHTPPQDLPAPEQAVIAAARAVVAEILTLHPQIREANPRWFQEGTIRLVAAVDALDAPEGLDG